MKHHYGLSLLLSAGLLACNVEQAADLAPGGSTGRGGSMARFTVAQNHLYVVNQSDLRVYDVARPTDPHPVGSVPLTFGAETIFPFNNHLLIGTQTGMYIFGLTNPARPNQLGVYEHVVSCDPVVAQGNYAFVTLRSGTACRQGINTLDVVDIRDMRGPRLLKSYPMQSPHGLGIDGRWLFVGEGDNGLKVFDATNPLSLKLVRTFTDVHTYDVIPQRNVLIVTGRDGIWQYRYGTDAEGNVASMELLSKLAVE